jgi:hypothetical protein
MEKIGQFPGRDLKKYRNNLNTANILCCRKGEKTMIRLGVSETVVAVLDVVDNEFFAMFESKGLNFREYLKERIDEDKRIAEFEKLFEAYMSTFNALSNFAYICDEYEAKS